MLHTGFRTPCDTPKDTPVHTSTPILHFSPAFCPVLSRPRGSGRKDERFGGRSKGRGEWLHSPIASHCHVLATDYQPGHAHSHSGAGVYGELLTPPQPRRHRQSTAGGWGAAPVLGGCSPQRSPSALPLEGGVSGRHPQAWCHQVYRAQKKSMQTPERLQDLDTPRGPPRLGLFKPALQKPLLPRWSEHM